MLRVRQANRYADFTGLCPDTSRWLRQPLRGDSPVLREMFPGNCSDTARLLPGECPDDSADGTPDILPYAARTLRDVLPYIHVRGWCLAKIKAFKFSESRH
jgi:hypothetical protein